MDFDNNNMRVVYLLGKWRLLDIIIELGIDIIVILVKVMDSV